MGDFYAAGHNYNYSLGLGDDTARYTFTQVAGDWAQIAHSGLNWGAGIKTDGTLWAWGTNANYQLGLGHNTTVTTPTQVGTATDWAAVSCGEYHMLALKTDGTLWAVGSNARGQTGVPEIATVTTLTQVGADTWSFILAQGRSSHAIKSNGTLWGWGDNDTFGLLGLNTTTVFYTTPTQESTASNKWVAVSRTKKSYDAHLIGLQSDGTLWGWGYNATYQLGLGDTTKRLLPTRIGADADWAAIGTGTFASYAIKSNGTLWGWGNGGYNALGIAGDTANKLTPTQIGADTDWSAVTGAEYAMLAIKTDGRVFVSGYNSFGYLGTGNTSQVVGLTEVVVSGVPNTCASSSTEISIGYAVPYVPPPPEIVLVPAARAYAVTGYLSGAENATTDYPLPLMSVLITKRSAAVSYYAISMPFSLDLINAISARPDGKIYLLRDGAAWEFFNQGFPVFYDVGPFSGSIRINGTRQETISGAAAFDLAAAAVIKDGLNSQGKLTLDVAPGVYDLRPTDTITWRGVDYAVELVRTLASPGLQSIQINAVPV
jgi:alpha-tubulin suppressor-like RCC1 family protein